jgi:hypothetical protein
LGEAASRPSEMKNCPSGACYDSDYNKGKDDSPGHQSVNIGQVASPAHSQVQSSAFNLPI